MIRCSKFLPRIRVAPPNAPIRLNGHTSKGRLIGLVLVLVPQQRLFNALNLKNLIDFNLSSLILHYIKTAAAAAAVAVSRVSPSLSWDTSV